MSTNNHGGGSLGRKFYRSMAVMASLFLVTASLSAQSFTASFSQQYLQVGQPAVLSLSFEGTDPTSPPETPTIDGAQIFFNGKTRQWESRNGVARVQFIYNYLVMPTKAGELVVPELKATVNGREVTAPSIKIEVVTPEGAAKAEEKILGKLAFVRVSVPKEEAYVGEVIPAQIKVYATSPENLQLHQFKAEGFTLGKASHTSQSREVIDGQPYHVVTFHMPIAARMIGQLPVGPAECTLNVRVPTRAGRSSDPFAGNPLFSRGNMRPMRITSEVQHVNVLPLPTNNVPSNFNGAVGQFNMQVSATPTELPAGDPITYTVRINARGTLDDLKLPEQNGWREFKTYPPDAKVIQKDALGIAGVKQFEQIVIPTHAEIKELPPFQFAFFDPEQRRYRTLTQAAIPLTVQPSAAQNVQPSYVGSAPFNAPEPEEETVEDIAHIEPRLGSAVPGSLMLLRSPWFYILQLIPIGSWLGLLFHRKRQERLARDPRALRRRQVERLIQSGLKELALHAERGETDQFFETTLRMLKEQIAERFDLPAVSITEDIVDEKLKPLGLPTKDLDRVHELFQTCNHARYAGDVSVAGLHHTKAELEAVLDHLKQLPAS